MNTTAGPHQAAVVVAPRTFELRSLDTLDPGPGQVSVAVSGCGVCGSNVPTWEGRPWFQYPLVPGSPGHEGWGEVEAVGDGVLGVRPGDPVAILSNDAFAERVVVAADQVVVLPEVLRDAVFPGESIGSGFNVARRSAFRAGDTVAVIGVGFIGAIVTMLAAAAGARVIAISRRESALDVARSNGASDTIVMDDHQRIIDSVTELTDGALCNIVVEAVGTQWPLDLAGQLTGFGGRLVVAGYHQDGQRTVDMQLWNWRGIDVINAHERDPEVVRQGVREAAAAVAAGTIDPAPLYTHRFPLGRFGEAMDSMLDRPDGFMKALVIM